MQSFKYIKNILIAYLISGAVLGSAIFSLITLHRYSNHLVHTLNVMKNISSNKGKVRGEINKMDAVIKYLKDDLRLNEVNGYSEISFYQRLDDIKTNIKDASITITKFEETEGEKILPVQIVAPVKNYRTLVDYAGYVESFNVPPVFKVKNFSVIRDQAGHVVLNIQGTLGGPIESKK